MLYSEITNRYEIFEKMSKYDIMEKIEKFLGVSGEDLERMFFKKYWQRPVNRFTMLHYMEGTQLVMVDDIVSDIMIQITPELSTLLRIMTEHTELNTLLTTQRIDTVVTDDIVTTREGTDTNEGISEHIEGVTTFDSVDFQDTENDTRKDTDTRTTHNQDHHKQTHESTTQSFAGDYIDKLKKIQDYYKTVYLIESISRGVAGQILANNY